MRSSYDAITVDRGAGGHTVADDAFGLTGMGSRSASAGG
jgi:hypothetical protein